MQKKQRRNTINLNQISTAAQLLPDSVWKGKAAKIKIGKEIILVPFQSAAHYLTLKHLRDGERIFYSGA